MPGDQRGTRPPSIYDVARRAGVSYQTVSRVVNGAPSVSEKSRTKVQSAISELDFHPSSAARAFSTGRGQDLGIIGSGLDSYGWQAMLTGIQQAARANGRGIVLHDLQDPGSAASWMKSQTVFATLIFGSSPAARELMGLLPARERIIGIGDREIPGFDWISFAEYDGAVAAVTHLVELGHDTTAFVTTEALSMTLRHDGWRDTVGYRSGRHEVFSIGPASADAYQQGLILARERWITAIVCANDQIALPLLAGLRDGGRRVPDDVSVVGFDDHPLAPYASPPLTTVRQDFLALGRLAVRFLETGRENPAKATTVVLSAHLVRRNSSGIAP